MASTHGPSSFQRLRTHTKPHQRIIDVKLRTFAPFEPPAVMAAATIRGLASNSHFVTCHAERGPCAAPRTRHHRALSCLVHHVRAPPSGDEIYMWGAVAGPCKSLAAHSLTTAGPVKKLQPKATHPRRLAPTRPTGEPAQHRWGATRPAPATPPPPLGGRP